MECTADVLEKVASEQDAAGLNGCMKPCSEVKYAVEANEVSCVKMS